MHRFISIIVILSGALSLGQSKLFPDVGQNLPSDPPKSQAAIDAKAMHDGAIKRAHEAFVKSELAADQAYIDALAKLEDGALKQGLPGETEAARLHAARLNATVDRDAHQAAGQSVVISHASYGANGKYVDVTEKINQIAAANSGSFTVPADASFLGMADPVPGTKKILEISGTINGSPFKFACTDGGYCRLQASE